MVITISVIDFSLLASYLSEFNESIFYVYFGLKPNGSKLNQTKASMKVGDLVQNSMEWFECLC